MIGNLTTALTPVAIAAGIVALFVGVPLLLGRAIALADRLDDGADVPFSEPHEAHVREAIAVANDEPDPDFIARTRRVVVDELAQRRGAVSCTCAGTAPGFPQHEDWCGKPEEDECRPGCLRGPGHEGDCLDDEDIAEERLRSRDYDAWAAL